MNMRILLGVFLLLSVSSKAFAIGIDMVADPQDFYVTSDGSGTHTTTAGATAFGVNIDGVGDLTTRSAYIPTGYVGKCTASLISTRHILTAAHCVDTNDDGDADIYNTSFVTFELATGTVSVNIASAVEHTLWTGDTANGYDFAVIELASDVTGVPIYTLNSFVDELLTTSVKVGYGNTGYGETGAEDNTLGQKRAGLNLYDTDMAGVDSALGGALAGSWGLSNTGTQLAYDFDSGAAENDSMGSAMLHINDDLGFGADEIGAAPGDSGGATFIFDGNEWVIAGVTSYGFGWTTNPPDSNPGTNSSWGDIGVDARVASAQAFIESATGGLATFNSPSIIPLPSTLWMFLLTGPALAFSIRRRA